MAQVGAVDVVGVAVAAQMFLKVQTTAANKCYQSCSKLTVSVLCSLVSSIKFNIACSDILSDSTHTRTVSLKDNLTHQDHHRSYYLIVHQ